MTAGIDHYGFGKVAADRRFHRHRGRGFVQDDEIHPGVRDDLVTVRLRHLLESLPPEMRAIVDELDDTEVAQRLASHLAGVARRALDDREPPSRSAATNELLTMLEEGDDDQVVEPPRVLSYLGSADGESPPLPDIPLSEHDLLVNARGEPHLAAELKKEIASADGIDLIVAFVRWYGVRLLVDELRTAIARGVPVRLLTTTYTGSTERRALDELTELGVEVRVSYDTQMTRLHAKSFIFHRDSGFSTAYVGSSNLTRTALLDGREWNVRLSRAASSGLFDKVATAFTAQWESPDYEAYDPERFVAAVTADRRPEDDESPLSGLQLRAWPYQDEILDALTVEREVHGSPRNLVEGGAWLVRRSLGRPVGGLAVAR